MCVIQHTGIWPNFILIVLFKRKKHKCNFHYVAMSMIMSQILKSVNFTKTQKFRYLENEMFFHQIKKNSLITHQGLLYCKKNSFMMEVTFKKLNGSANDLLMRNPHTKKLWQNRKGPTPSKICLFVLQSSLVPTYTSFSWQLRKLLSTKTVIFFFSAIISTAKSIKLFSHQTFFA